MRELIYRRVTVVWLLLVAATALSWWLGTGRTGAGGDLTVVSSLVVAVALIKVRFVIREFMEVRGALPALRYVTDGWVFGVLLVLLYLYWSGL